MSNYFSKLFMVYLLIIFEQSFAQTTITAHLNSNWQFFYNNNWYSTTVPNSIHTDLFNNNLIEDPFYADNESRLQWIGKQQWQYKTMFDMDSSLLQKQVIELIFKGLDTYCKVYLNDSLILQAYNMFREWKINCKEILKAENNTLIIDFDATENISKELYDHYPVKKLPGEERVMTRKAQYHYGWDFAPRFITCGIWQDVQLKAWDYFTLNDFSFQTDSIKENVAYITGVANVSSTGQSSFLLSVSDKSSGNKWVYAQTEIEQGENTFTYNFKIPDVKRWWCNAEGEPYLYNVFIEATDNKERWNSTEQKFGVRTIEVIQQQDSAGKSFFFRLNGKPVFMKGANYIPQDVFINRVSDAKYEAILSDVKNAGMNMLRVWGGGVYGKDIFYKLCDEKGILIWQDFMFACGMYPYDEAFLDNVKEEAQQQVKRLNKYACIALWCGNNENSEGWHRWGWQNNYDSLQQIEIWNGYQKIFNKILPDAVKQNSNTFYWETSPQFGRGDILHTKQGDAHNWFVWHDGESFENYEKKVPRFMSEYGFQSLPDMETLKTFGDEKDLNRNSASIKAHQKHARGFAIIDEYMKTQFKKIPADFMEYIKLSQQLQADGIMRGMNAHLKAKPYCMGSLIWQLNDCWPGISWSMIDYTGRKKILYTEVKKLLSVK